MGSCCSGQRSRRTVICRLSRLGCDLNKAIALIRTPLLAGSHPTRWADLGAGSGLFTKALAGLLYAGSEIYAVDKKAASVFSDFPQNVKLNFLTLDFLLDELPFNELDGILMANSFHYCIRLLSVTELSRERRNFVFGIYHY